MKPVTLTRNEARAWLRRSAPKARLPRNGSVLYVPFDASPATPQLVWACRRHYSGYSVTLEKAAGGGQ